MMIYKITPSVNTKTQHNQPTNQISIKVPNVISQQKENVIISKTLGTSEKKRPNVPPLPPWLVLLSFFQVRKFAL